MATKKKTTARTTGLTGNQFASVEQGRSYVLSVHSPSGAGEIELLAADSDQQSEPDMFSMLYEKIETARQIPFVAISPFVFVNVGSSDVQWLVTPANFSIAVPGASSGGGSSFDPASDQRYIKYLSMTEAEYKALGEKANNCIYYLTDKSMWAIGDKEIVTSDMPA